MIKQLTSSFAVILLFWGCTGGRSDTRTGSIMGFKPIYASSGDMKAIIRSSPAKNLTETGKIYVKGGLLLINKPFSGVHVIDNTDPAKPVNLSFLEIPGNIDVSMKGNFLYADYAGKIAVIDVTDIANPRVTQSVELDTKFQNYPPQADIQNRWTTRTYFECPDPSKGLVVGWMYTTLKSPKCWKDEQ
jgi:hypothetical protein